MSRCTRVQLEQAENNPQVEDWLKLQQLPSKYGTDIEIIQADVTRLDDVHEIIERFSKTSYPVRGIIHSAAVTEDKLLAILVQDILKRVMGPKIRGAWNFHRASQAVGIPLHFFIMFSSIRNHLIDLGSSSYNAGNEFVDALAYYLCQKMRQPSLSISLPAISDAGMFHRQ